MVLEALHLDDHLRRTVDEVDPADPERATDIDLTVHRRLAVLGEELGEAQLQAALAGHVLDGAVGEELTHRCDPGPTLHAQLVEHRVDRRPVEQVSCPGLLEQALQPRQRQASAAASNTRRAPA